MNKWGYIFAHVALIVICLGGLIDSNLLLKLGMLTGRIVPDNQAVYAKDFKPESILGASNLSFRATSIFPRAKCGCGFPECRQRDVGSGLAF